MNFLPSSRYVLPPFVIPLTDATSSEDYLELLYNVIKSQGPNMSIGSDLVNIC